MSILAGKREAQKALPLSDMMIDYWVDFAISGNPSGSGHLERPTYDTESRERMYLDIPPRVEKTDKVEKCEFWRDQDMSIVGSLESEL